MPIANRKICLLFSVVLLCFIQGIVAAEKPNVVLIVSDDQAWSDYGFMGHADVKTPNLDALAKRSLLFSRGYVSSPLCRPSLASIVTGLYPYQHCVTGNDVDGANNRAALSAKVTAKFHTKPSMIKTLVANGYLAHQSGKWWEGSYADGGFTHGMTHGDSKRGGRHGDKGLSIGRQGLKPIADFMDLAIEQHKPFFVWYAPFLPHSPHNPPERLLRKYTKEGREEDVAKYYAMCEWFDETCGDLVKLIDDRNLRKNTVFIYICDNGWAARSTNTDDPNQKLWNGFALRSKGSPFENGIRTPIMVSWPGKVTPGHSKDLAHAIDLFPTVCSAAGIAISPGLPGINLMDSDATAERTTIFGVTNAIHNMTPATTDGDLQYLWAIDGDYKLIVRYAGENRTRYANIHNWDKVPIRLYDIVEDPHEKYNLAEKQPEIAKRILDKIEAWHPVKDDFQFRR